MAGQPFSSGGPGVAAQDRDRAPLSVGSAQAVAPRAFAELDERLIAASAGAVLVRAPASAAQALLAHVARRIRASGQVAVHVRQAHARVGAPMWQEVASRLALARVDCDPARTAEQIAAALSTRRAVVVAPLPPLGTWDRAVAAELARSRGADGNAALLVFVTGTGDAAIDVQAERFDVAAELDDAERRRWWSAVAEDGHARVGTEELSALESWWSAVKRSSAPTSGPERGALSRELPVAGATLFAALSLAMRAWPETELVSLAGGAAAAYEGLTALIAAGAVQVERGWVAIETGWDSLAASCAADASPEGCAMVARALVTRFEDEPWAHVRAAELLLRVNDADAVHSADAAYATAISRVDDALARREIVSRWMDAVDAVSPTSQLALRIRAAERALAVGEAEEAYRWAKAASTLATDDARVTLLLGRAAVALGDLVSAKVALERGRLGAHEDELAALIAVELAEVEYLTGDMSASKREASAAMAGSTDTATVLRARNTLGKVLLAEAKWDEADRHFAEDAQTASAHGQATAELRARLNRGIALLSKGHVDEARSIFEAVLADGERTGDARACAFALDNLAVVATWRHEYAAALSLSERTLKLRQRLGDRLTTARILANVAELRRKLGLLDHAEHAVAFGRRTLGPGMPAGRSTEFAIVAARIALHRGNTVDARREIAKAIVDAKASQNKKCLAEAHRLATRIALEDGDVGAAGDSLGLAGELSSTDEGRAEVALLQALRARACGEPSAERCLPLANDALNLARVCGEEELLRETHVLLCELCRTIGDMGAARMHLDQALALRDQVADALPTDVRTAFLARPTVADLVRLQSTMAQVPAPCSDAGDEEEAPRTQRSIRPAPSVPRDMVGDDPAIRGLLAAVRKVARSNSTVLVRGESGTGKELVAEALHRASDRASGPLVTVNCAALVETLLLSELFGHEKGAFTGAFARRRGRFEMAEGGTLFLDEIGDISPRTQVALLRVLQERTFERVGGTIAIRANVRIICATHRDLRAMVERGEFREDLYYRLRGITLEVPALRARMGDLPRISEHLLSRIAVERGESSKALSPDALELLARHRWAGNVRELENALRAASLFADDALITAADLVDNVDDLRAVAAGMGTGPSSLRSSILPPPPLTGPTEVEIGSLSGDFEHDPQDVLDPDVPLPSGESGATAIAYLQVRQGAVSLSDMKRQIERDCIARALAETKGNITRAATLLGMKRPRLSQLVKQYGLAAVSSEAP